MQESIQAALTVAKNIANKEKIKKDFFETHDLHIHVPEGATPKDGPSAGITMCTAIASVVLIKRHQSKSSYDWRNYTCRKSFKNWWP